MFPESVILILLYAVALFVARFLLSKSNKIGLKKQITNLPRWASQTKPVLGGVTFYIVMLTGVLISILWLGDQYNFYNAYNLTLFFALTVAFIMGLADDMLNTSPYFKFAVQLVVSFAFIIAGYYIRFFDSVWLNYLVTVFWVVGIMNSINMLDNMDAITSSVSLVILSFVAFISIITYRFDYGILAYVTVPALLAFLNFNWHPSKMYMGDNGSQFLGALLAGLGIYFVWNHDFNPGLSKVDTVIAVALMFLLPLVDTTTVTVNRLMKGVSPFKGDKNHTTHNLVYAGLSERAVAIFFIIISLISSALASAVLLGWLTLSGFARILLTAFILAVFTGLYVNTKIKHYEGKNA